MENQNQMTQQEMEKHVKDLFSEENMNRMHEEWKKEFDEAHDQFLDQHDWNTNPSHIAKCVTGWTKKNMLLEAWNQWLACEEAQAEFMGWEDKGRGWNYLGEMRRFEQLEGFSHYLVGYAKALADNAREDLAKKNETV